jgi:hypothetical protein
LAEAAATVLIVLGLSDLTGDALSLSEDGVIDVLVRDVLATEVFVLVGTARQDGYEEGGEKDGFHDGSSGMIEIG